MNIDLRSDTVTKPTPGMLNAMMSAKVGDDVYQEDETINLLEARIAKMFGKSHAMFFPSGTMANQTAIKIHTNPGDQVICDKYAHIYNYEGGGASFNSGVSCKLIDGYRGMFTAKDVIEAINPPEFYHSPLSKLVEIENTTNKGGGACWDLNELEKIKQVCNTNNLGFHLDGARLWNALVAKNETPQQYGAIFDTISVCLSKGLGCPIGSVLTGDEKFMTHALRIRKMLGGGMRQGGFLAAAGLYALDHNIDRLKDDHTKAKELSLILQSLHIVKHVEPTETNIVIFELAKDVNSEDFILKLKANNITISDMGQGKLRLVTHIDYTDNMHSKTLETLKQLQF
ncbi:L-allo-threonine aldolase [Formosa agariphila KMM 3901]|uniref:L-allo-threonine aldolase n=1 Tax=Formosa agariphila (strain DSM 15362 / KCTC 12365 / LMG 23005 / KMM 3901 / M-2Alg 35-1) TaxID=1347342 RepID=T2KRH7_FORAG|nr:GntG family PLP-dependent aldolase [Formosa agariphila]CDF81066.1 L-allo-threonine aldolase [Formosa agariphila KMM 3901]